jgi:hypothetical protein
MQEYDYIPQLKLTTRDFWREARARAREQDADEILSYMILMLEKATRTSGVKITKKAFLDYGRTVRLYPGARSWFPRINAFGGRLGASVKHFIISSGIREMILGTPIAREFERVYASAFMFDQNGVAYWPALALNFTAKTQFLFRINKGVLDPWDDSRINDFIPMAERPVPFSRMIYIGDGATDIPCMKLVKEQRGYAIAVFPPGPGKKASADRLLRENRVNFTAPADYRTGRPLDLQVKATLRKIMAEHAVLSGEKPSVR